MQNEEKNWRGGHGKKSFKINKK
jgi:hypothetical protein